MYNNILIAYDERESSKHAFEQAIHHIKKLVFSITELMGRGSIFHYLGKIDAVQDEKGANVSFIQKIKNYTHSGNFTEMMIDNTKANSFDIIFIRKGGCSNLCVKFIRHTTNEMRENAYCNMFIVR